MANRVKGIVRLCMAAILLAAGSAARSESATSVNAALGAQFDQHPLLMVGELHRNGQLHAFLRQLIRDPAFICRVDDVVVEFGNARLQSVIDTYIAGGDVPDAQLQIVWRDTTVFLVWNSPVYRQFYETVRDINQKHVCPHPIRVVLGDPPIDWSTVKAEKDYEKFSDRDGYFATVVEQQVLAKKHRALLIAGELHALKQVPKDEPEGPDGPDVAQLIERRHPGALFSVVTVPSPSAAKALGMGPPPSFKVVRGSDIEQADFAVIAPAWTATLIVVNGKHVWQQGPAKYWPRMGGVVDGVLYLGGDETSVYPSPTIYLDPVYQQQLRHRALLIKQFNGQDFMPVLDDLIKEGEQVRKQQAQQ
jgi:hypothetical protein